MHPMHEKDGKEETKNEPNKASLAAKHDAFPLRQLWLPFPMRARDTLLVLTDSNISLFSLLAFACTALLNTAVFAMAVTDIITRRR